MERTLWTMRLRTRIPGVNTEVPLAMDMASLSNSSGNDQQPLMHYILVGIAHEYECACAINLRMRYTRRLV